MDWDQIKFFKEEEFADDKGECWVDMGLVHMVDVARFLAGIAFIITSACSNPEQDAKAGRKSTSSHPKGLAVDIYASSDARKFIIVNALLKAGFIRIGIGKDFVHADKDDSKTQNVIWTY